MRYWLFKSEPDTFGIDHLERDGTTEWSGVRNYQARNYMREMQPGDQGFFYHSNAKPPGIAGTCRIVRAAYPDHTAWKKGDYFDPKSTPERPIWEMVDVAFGEKFPRVFSLDELREHEKLAEMLVLRRGQRLSIMPVTGLEWKYIHALVRKEARAIAGPKSRRT